MPVPHQQIELAQTDGTRTFSDAGRALTILKQDVEALLDEKSGIEHDEPEADRKNIVTVADFEEILDLLLCGSKVTWGVSRTVPAKRCSVPAAAARSSPSLRGVKGG